MGLVLNPGQAVFSAAGSAGEGRRFANSGKGEAWHTEAGNGQSITNVELTFGY